MNSNKNYFFTKTNRMIIFSILFSIAVLSGANLFRGKNQVWFEREAGLKEELIQKYEEKNSGNAEIGRIKTPSIYPTSGTFTTNISVTLATETAGADIYYTRDGSEPDENSLRYTGVILITNSLKIKAIALKAGMLTSEISEAEYSILHPPIPSSVTFTALPLGTSAHDATNGTIQLNLTGISGATHFIIYFGTNSDRLSPQNIVFGTGNTITNLPLTLSNLRAGVYYTWIVPYNQTTPGNIYPENQDPAVVAPPTLTAGNGSSLSPLLIFNAIDLTNYGAKSAGNAQIPSTSTYYRSAWVKLMADIDMSGISNWSGIGNVAYPFNGKFDGNNKFIKNSVMNFATTTANSAGIFPKINGALVYNLNISNALLVSVRKYGGILSGDIITSTISNVHVHGSLFANNVADTFTHIGGFAGGSYSSKISFCSANVVSVTSNYHFIGGFLGDSSDVINSCASYGSIYTTNSNPNGVEIGGFIGYIDGPGKISNCYVSMDLTGKARIGGFASHSFSVTSNYIINCISMGQILQIQNSVRTGFFNYLESVTSPRIVNCIAFLTNVNGSTSSDSSIARVYRTNTSVTTPMFKSNYAYENMHLHAGATTYAVTDRTPGGADGADLSVIQFKTETFYTESNNWDIVNGTAWDFLNIWQMSANGPILRNFPVWVRQEDWVGTYLP